MKYYTELKQRYDDLLNDPLHLQWNNWSKSNPLIRDGKNLGSVEGHKEQYEGKRTHLRNLIDEWDDDDCNKTGRKIPQYIRDLSYQPAPNPIPQPKPTVNVDWGKFAQGTGLIVAGSLILAGTLAEDVVTYGGGVADDPYTIGAGGGLFGGGLKLLQGAFASVPF